MAAPCPRMPAAGPQRRGLRSTAAVELQTSDNNVKHPPHHRQMGFMDRLRLSGDRQFIERSLVEPIQEHGGGRAEFVQGV
ncbi:hypothetical protein D3C80_1945390 [compost metagenome]